VPLISKFEGSNPVQRIFKGYKRNNFLWKGNMCTFMHVKEPLILDERWIMAKLDAISSRPQCTLLCPSMSPLMNWSGKNLKSLNPIEGQLDKVNCPSGV
jgi:hypothetical protein